MEQKDTLDCCKGKSVKLFLMQIVKNMLCKEIMLARETIFLQNFVRRVKEINH